MKVLIKVTLGLILGLVMSLPTQAWNIDQAVVKVISRDSTTSTQMRGSGLLFRHRGIVYVVTSEHVVYASRASRFLQQAKYGSTVLALELMSSDFASGLALLKVSDSTPLTELELPTLEDFIALSIARTGAGVQTAGFAWSAEALSLDRTGEVLNVATDRLVLPAVPRVIELLHAHGEFGMSGGGVFTQTALPRVLGILSHQSIEMVPGTAGRLSSSHEGLNQNHVFVIPAPFVRQWVLEILEGRLPQMVRSPLSPDHVTCEGVEFEFLQTPSGQTGIGGTDVVGIGGTDVVGIGGSDTTSRSPFLIKARRIERGSLYLASTLQSGAGVSADLQRWFTSLKRTVENTPEVLITGLMLREQDSVRVVMPGSLAEVFGLLIRRNAVVMSGAENTELPAELRAALTRVVQDCQQMPEALSAQVALMRMVLESPERSSWRRPDLMRLEAHASWNTYFSEHFNEAVSCTQALDALGDLL